jgi:hypothetical protein
MLRVGFEPMTPVFERKTVHASDRASTVVGRARLWFRTNKLMWLAAPDVVDNLVNFKVT